MDANLSYPIGKYEPQPFSQEKKEKWLLDIKFLPQDVEQSVSNLDAHQLDTSYREGGWTVKQLVHHIADSHMNAYIRFKLGLTEDNPTIKPYEQDKWVLLADIDAVPINVSLTILHGVHQRMLATIKNLSQAEWERTVVHPEHGKQMTLWYLLGMYAWHGRHHTKHITALRERMGW
jgi:DinB superfamily